MIASLSEGVACGAQLGALVARFERYAASSRPPEGAQLGADLVALRHLVDLVELQFSEFAAAWSRSGEWERAGSISSVDWVRHNCHMSGNAAAERLTVGEQAEQLAASVEAVKAGAIGYAHLALMSHTAEAVSEVPGAASVPESALLLPAREMSVSRFRYYCQHLRHAADQEGVALEQKQQVERRSLQVSQAHDGRLFLNGVLDLVGGAMLRTALEPLAKRTGEHDDRSRRQRLADALVELAGHNLKPAQLQVTASIETLRGLAGSAAGELEFAPPISAKTVERLACSCSLTRVILGADSMVIDVGRSKRLPAAAQRRALRARDKHCRWPGCERPASWTVPHHLLHWTKGGPTDMPNLVSLCNRHHWLVHEGGWQLVGTVQEGFKAIPPDSRIASDWPRGPDASAA